MKNQHVLLNYNMEDPQFLCLIMLNSQTGSHSQVASKEGRSGSQVLTDLTSPTEAVSSKKNLFEAGEAWKQNTTSVTPSKVNDDVTFFILIYLFTVTLINNCSSFHSGFLTNCSEVYFSFFLMSCSITNPNEKTGRGLSLSP